MTGPPWSFETTGPDGFARYLPLIAVAVLVLVAGVSGYVFGYLDGMESVAAICADR